MPFSNGQTLDELWTYTDKELEGRLSVLTNSGAVFCFFKLIIDYWIGQI